MLERRGLHTIGRAATLIGRNPSTIRRWIKAGLVTPDRVQCGSQAVAVFSDADIRSLKKLANESRVGRPPAGLTPMKRGHR
jgi:DNA-binding transcriptional MerR regulator